ncbi:YaaA family protein, partial [Romboutsia ilealis]
MITIISPATTMNFDKDINLENSSDPVFKEDINYIISILKELNIKEISDLMNLSEDLSKLNYDRYQNLLNSNNKKLQSILAFDGEVFNSINVSDFNEYDFKFANDHLRILSGLYGILSPLDLIEPYRLEMKAKL